MRPYWLAILSILLFCEVPRAEIVTVTVEATGVDLQDATSNALVEAVRQVNGVSISASQLLETTTVSGMVSDLEGNSASFSSTQRQRGAVGAKSGGHLASYEILDSGPSEYGYRIVLKAGIHRYRTPGIASDNRRKLALIPFGNRLSAVDFFGPINGADLANNLSDSMLTQFVQSRRFAILDRESWGAIGDELALLASATTPISEKAKLGRTLGADYLVLGELLEADGGDFVQAERLTGVRKRQAIARIAVAYRIVVPATGEIKFADTVEIAEIDQQGHLLTSRTSALNELSKRLVGIALDRIYPMQVISTDDSGQIVLNQGGSTLSMGDRLILVEQGKAMIDPYTKEPLGHLETPVAQIEVIRVDGKMTYARLLGDSSMSPKIGQLARRDLALYGAGNAIDVPSPSPRSEGVRLPFDR